MGEVHRLMTPEPAFGLQAAGRLMIKIFPAWVQDLALLVESVEPVRPPGAADDWQPGAVVRLPFSKKNCCDGEVVCSQGTDGARRHCNGHCLFGRLERLSPNEHD